MDPQGMFLQVPQLNEGSPADVRAMLRVGELLSSSVAALEVTRDPLPAVGLGHDPRIPRFL